MKKGGGLFIVVISLFGAGTVAVGLLGSTWLAAAVLFVLGIGNGFVGIVFITRLQQRTRKELLGRVMSLVLLAGVALAPISQAVSGAALRFGPVALFTVAGILITATSLLSIANRAIRTASF